jgi:hypothetical protein
MRRVIRSLLSAASLVISGLALSLLGPTPVVGQAYGPYVVDVAGSLQAVATVTLNSQQADRTGLFPFGTVPSGKRLVIQHVSAEARMPTGQRLRVTLNTRLSGEPSARNHFLMMAFQAVLGGLDVLTASQPIIAYADSNEQIGVNVQRTASTGTATVKVTITGQLADRP